VTSTPAPRRLQDALDVESGLHRVAAGTSTAGVRQLAARGVPPESSFRVASLTKTFTSAALVLTMREQEIPLDVPAVGLLPALAPDWRADRGLTVEQILGQVSGVRFSVEGATVAPLTLTEAARLVVRAGNEREPGARWSYYNGNYFLAGAILAALTGTDYETALRRRLLDPWKLTRTTFAAPHEYPPARRPSGGLWSCVPDLLTFGEQLMGDRSLLGETRDPRTTPGDPMTYGLRCTSTAGYPDTAPRCSWCPPTRMRA
jgi:D-alanyl-D-alanine carboxypeptidase